MNFYALTVRVTVEINMYVTFFNLIKKELHADALQSFIELDLTVKHLRYAKF